MIYFGFDLGDGESCISWSRDPMYATPNIAPVSGRGSFFSAVGQLDGRTVVGSNALNVDAEDVHVCFKRHFLEHSNEVDRIIREFVRGILEELRKNKDIGSLVDDEEQSCFVVGCPAGWEDEDRKRYKKLLTEAGMKNVKVVSESRAAFENAFRSRENVIDQSLFSKSVLVIDIGSSTLDFAYVNGGNEYDIANMENILLGGGLMDEMIVLYAISQLEAKDPENAGEVRKLIEESDSQKSKLMIAARELKEDYFNNEERFLDLNEPIEKSVRLFGNNRIYRVNLVLSPEIVEDWLISRPHPLLDGQSFESRLRDSLISACDQTRKIQEPELVIITGGASRMRFFQELCRKQFSRSQIVISEEPEYDISRGLVYVGDVDERMSRCVESIKQYAAGDSVEKIVKAGIPDLIENIIQPLTDSVLEDCVRPAFDDWRSGQTENLNDFQKDAGQKINEYMKSSMMQDAIRKNAQPWSQRILTRVEQDLGKISREYQVDFMLKPKQIFIHPGDVETGGTFRINIVTLIQTIISIVLVGITGMLCGGAGLALIVETPLGIIIGAVVAAVALIIGREPIKHLIMSFHVPKLMRKMVSADSICSRKNADKISKALQADMLNDENMVDNLVEQVGKCIDDAIMEATVNIEKAMAQ